jgi:transposase-like protein
MSIRDACPACGSTYLKKNGHVHSGKQNHRCKACGRQFVASGEDHIISNEHRTLIEYLLRERISLRGICRAVGVSLTWLLHFMVERFAACPDHLHVQLPAGHCQVNGQSGRAGWLSGTLRSFRARLIAPSGTSEPQNRTK